MNLTEILEKNHQDSVLKALSALQGEDRRKLEAQLQAINWEELPELIRDYVLNRPATEVPPDLKPASYFPICPANEEQKILYGKALREGRAPGSDSTARKEPFPLRPSFTRPCSSILPKACCAPERNSVPPSAGTS